MTTLADYEAWKANQAKASVGAAQVVIGSTDANPDEVARDMTLASDFAKVTGNPQPPAAMVPEYRNIFQAEIEKKRAETILTTAPRLTEWLRNPDNAVLARDDLNGLSWFERMGKSFDMGNATAVTQGREVMRDTGAVLETSALGRGLDAAGDVFDDTVLTNGDGDPNLLGRLANYLRGRASEADGVERQMVGGPDMTPEQRGAALAKQDLGVIYDAGKAMLEDLSKQGFEPMSFKDVKGLGSALSFITENIAMSAPQMAATMASGGFGPFVNLVLSTGEVNNELAGKLPDMEPANRVALAFGAGTAVAALDVIGMGKVFGGLGVTEVAERAAAGTLAEVLVTNGMTKAAAGVMSAAIAEGTTETLQEAIMMGTTSIAGGEYTGEEVIDRLAQSFFAGAGAGGGMHAGGKAASSAAAAGARMSASKEKATAAKDRVAVFEALSGQAQSSKLRERMPEKFRQFVERATADGPVENVYIPADQFATYFQEQGLDPYEIAGALEGVSADDLRDAVNNGTDLKIPTSTYAASLAGSDVDGFLMQNMRFDPNEMTAAEAQAFNEKASDAMAEAWETAEAMRQEDEKWRGAEEKIYDEMVSRLRVAGRSTDVATSEAMIYPAFYRVMAERSGLTTDEFLTRYPLPQVRGALPEALAPKNVDELTRTLAEARNRRAPAGDKRQSLLEFIADRGGINDRGGELDAMDAATIKRGRGKKALKLKRETAAEGQGAMFGSGDGGSYGPDNVALAAIEAGFMADHPAVIEYKAAMERGDEAPDLTRALWDAIGAEVRGETQFSDHDTGPVDESHLDEIERYLAQIGLSLDDDDATIRAGIEAARDEDARMYGQDGVVNTDSAAFKAWFGDSKVVDENGEPLVVYHGSDFADQGSDEFAFETGRRGKRMVLFSEKDTVSSGIFLSPSSDDARSYGSSVGEYYVSIKKPLADPRGSDAEATEGMSNAIDDILYIFDPVVSRSIGPDGEPDGGWSIDVDGGVSTSEGVGNDALIDVIFQGGLIEWSWLDNPEVSARMMERGYDGAQVYEPNDTSEMSWFALDPTQIKSVHNRGTFDGNDPRILYQDGHPFEGVSRSEFLGSAKITPNSNAASLTPKVLKSVESMDAVPFGAGKGLTAKYHENGAAVLDGDKVVASYNLGDTLVVDKKYRRQGIAEEIVYQWRMRFPKSPPASHRTKASQKLQEKVWDRISSELSGARPYGQSGNRLFQRNETSPRGQISIDGSGKAIISLFETANLSTMLHESGHFFLTVMQDLASKGEANSVAEYQAIKGWWRDNAAAVAADGLRAMPDTGITADDVKRAIDTGSTGDVLKDAAVDVGMQEQWARAFETYLMEGKAPSVELRGAFDKFRSWLISIYKRLTGTNVKVSDGIRQVFDRMLASDNEIAAAKADTGDMGPVFATAEEMGLTAEEYAAFIKLRGEADADSQARMLAEAMAPIKRERDEWFKKEKAAVREGVEREINAQPVYRAYEWMGNGRWIGDDEPENMPKLKLSKDVLVQRYGAGVLKTLTDGRKHVYSVEGGVDPDDVAGWFGFGSGDQMVKAIEAAPNRKATIDAETDRRMYELHGDVLRDGTAEAVALDAVHTDKKGQWLARELEAVRKITGEGVGLTAKEARSVARDTITRMKARDAVNSNRFLAAERKAGNEAYQLAAKLSSERYWINRAAYMKTGADGAPKPSAAQADMIARLYKAKRVQLLNHALYMESRKAAEEVSKAETYIGRLNKPSNRERIAGAGRRENAQIDYLAAIDDLQGRYDFRRMSGPAEARRGALQAYIDAMTAAGRENELSIPEKVRSNAARTPYKTLPMEELRGVIDSLKNLEHTAKRWNDLISGQRKRDFEETRDKIVDTIKTNTTEKPISWDAPANGWMKTLKDLGHDYIAGIYHASTILRRLDNTEDYGTVYDAIKTEIDEAAYGEREMRAKAARDIEAIMSVYSAEEQRDMGIKRHIPALGASFSKWHLISMARNMGNAGNLARLTNPKAAMHLTEPQVEVVKTLLDKRDWDYVQAIWDYNDTYRPLMAERERRVKGTEPTWVEATPVNTPHGQYRGGYFPIKYDGRLGGGRSDLTGTDEEVLQRMMKGGFVSASTKDGHLQARGANVDQSLTLEPGAWGMHVAEVIHDLTHSEAVINSFRLLTSAEVKSAMLKAGMDAEYNFLRLWLLDAASGQLGADSRVASAMQKVRNGFAFSKLAWSVKTALMQPLGIVQSAVVVGKKNLAVAVADYLKHPQEVSAEAMAKSRVLWERRETFQKDLMDAQAEGSIVSPSTSKAADLFDQYVVRYGTAGMVYTQLYTVDVPTWVAGYRLGLEKFDGNETKAIAFADNALHRAQSSGIWSDRSGYERGSLGMRSRQSAHVMLLTTLGSYFFAKTNLIIDRTNRLNSKPITATEAMDYAFDMFLIVLGETVALSMIGGATALALGDDGGDDDDESLISNTLLGGVQTITAGLPFIRDAASAASGFDGGTYDSLIGTMIKPFQQALQGEVDKSLVKGAINLGGMLFRLPSAQANRSLDAAWRAMEGEEVSPIEYVMGKQR